MRDARGGDGAREDGQTVPFRAVIVDDEELARVVLREHLATHPEVEIVAECANGFEAVKAVERLQPDILFLDVQMPKLDGFEVLELLPPVAAVVFVTAYDQYAVRAFEVQAVDYLLKPFRADRFEEALARAKARTRESLEPLGREALVREARPPGHLSRVVVKDGADVFVIPLSRLDWVQAQDDYVLLRHEGRDVLKQQTLSSLEAQLDPARFIRIHRSYLLNVDRLKKLEKDAKGGGTAILADGTRLPVSRSGMARLKELL